MKKCTIIDDKRCQNSRLLANLTLHNNKLTSNQEKFSSCHPAKTGFMQTDKARAI